MHPTFFIGDQVSYRFKKDETSPVETIPSVVTAMNIKRDDSGRATAWEYTLEAIQNPTIFEKVSDLDLVMVMGFQRAYMRRV